MIKLEYIDNIDDIAFLEYTSIALKYIITSEYRLLDEKREDYKSIKNREIFIPINEFLQKHFKDNNLLMLYGSIMYIASFVSINLKSESTGIDIIMLMIANSLTGIGYYNMRRNVKIHEIDSVSRTIDIMEELLNKLQEKIADLKSKGALYKTLDEETKSTIAKELVEHRNFIWSYEGEKKVIDLLNKLHLLHLYTNLYHYDVASYQEFLDSKKQIRKKEDEYAS